ncbi:MAG: hypothetical protein ACJ72C_10495 [Nitrososphaeraceae archaeon]|jgi:hypothetical protein
MAEIDWNELIGSKKSARACDKHSCGNVMAQYDDNIIIEGATIKSHEYISSKIKCRSL